MDVVIEEIKWVDYSGGDVKSVKRHNRLGLSIISCLRWTLRYVINVGSRRTERNRIYEPTELRALRNSGASNDSVASNNRPFLPCPPKGHFPSISTAFVQDPFLLCLTNCYREPGPSPTHPNRPSGDRGPSLCIFYIKQLRPSPIKKSIKNIRYN